MLVKIIMKTKITYSLTILLVVMLTTSCATLFGPKEHLLSFNSTPVGAEVFANGDRIGITPLKLELKPDKSYMIEFRKEGYKSITRTVHNRIGVKWIVLDILGGVIPIVVDAATGNWYEFDQEYINGNLDKE